MTKWRGTPRAARAMGLAVLAATFVAGGIAATALDQVVFAEPRSGAVEAERRGCPEKRRRLLDEVGLSAEQRAEVDEILARRRIQTDRFWREARPTLDAIMDSTRAEIRGVLSPEQRARYDELRRQKRERSKKTSLQHGGVGRLRLRGGS